MEAGKPEQQTDTKNKRDICCQHAALVFLHMAFLGSAAEFSLGFLPRSRQASEPGSFKVLRWASILTLSGQLRLSGFSNLPHRSSTCRARVHELPCCNPYN